MRAQDAIIRSARSNTTRLEEEEEEEEERRRNETGRDGRDGRDDGRHLQLNLLLELGLCWLFVILLGRVQAIVTVFFLFVTKF